MARRSREDNNSYQRKFYEKRLAEGRIKCQFWLERDADAALVAIMASTGEKKGDVLNRALLCLQKQIESELREHLEELAAR